MLWRSVEVLSKRMEGRQDRTDGEIPTLVGTVIPPRGHHHSDVGTQLDQGAIIVRSYRLRRFLHSARAGIAPREKIGHAECVESPTAGELYAFSDGRIIDYCSRFRGI